MTKASFKAAEFHSADSRPRLFPHLLLPSDTIMFGLTLGTIDSAGIERARVPHQTGKSQTGQKPNFRPSPPPNPSCVGFEETLGAAGRRGRELR